MGHTLRRGAYAALTAAAGAALLVGCAEEPPRQVMPGPTSTTTAAPQEATALAERYRAGGGDPDVYGIQVEDGPEGVPRVVVRTRNADEGDAIFRRQNTSVTAHLMNKEGASFKNGYYIDVFGPEGRLIHRMDARP
ncbi:hypothetical protein ACWGHM_08630 [Streptomyces sp. NPDC054904]|uniref:hypothetical protein n=1 Tax=unclassified Streptomyces TaxID=2593676 RepID=UPI0029BA0D86|nr:hypothetical protein [Streptomyces sp. DK15]MDX2391511.1 hypothetical protein [Streptomyces sp. DK15]